MIIPPFAPELRARGDLLLADIDAYIVLADQLIAKHGAIFMLDDFTAFGTAGPDVRKRLASWAGMNACQGAAFYGASIATRTIATLIVGARKLLGFRTLSLVFVKSEAEARLWIAAQR